MSDPEKVELRITTTDVRLLQELLGRPDTEEGGRVEIADGASLELTHRRHNRAWGEPEVLTFALNFATSVATPILANWIWEKIKSRKAKVEMDQAVLQEVTRQALEELLEQRRRDG